MLRDVSRRSAYEAYQRRTAVWVPLGLPLSLPVVRAPQAARHAD